MERMDDLINRKAVIDALTCLHTHDGMELGASVDFAGACEVVCGIPAVDAEPVITGDTSDGYHTFNELYHHRAVLFSVIIKAFPDRAWKSKKHHDGTMYDGMFIVGIETPRGQATYHYDIDPYWDMFECPELERAPEWDGHTPQEAIDRIGKLTPLRVTRCKDCVYIKDLMVVKDYREGAKWCMLNMHTVLLDDFCSNGERTEDE